MKILKKRERGYRFYIEKYDLNGAYAGKAGVPLGVLILFALVKDCGISFVELSAEAEGEMGEERNILSVSDTLLFTNVMELANVFQSQELVIWELECVYNGVKTYITGRTYGSILSVRSPLTSKINMMSLMSEAETATYNYHDYDQKLIDKLKSKFNMNQRVAIQSLNEMEAERDVFNEFMKGIQEEPFTFPNESPLTIEGHTAKELFEKYPLSEMGAYNYLIYLRNNPKAALKDLEDGLPRK